MLLFPGLPFNRTLALLPFFTILLISCENVQPSTQSNQAEQEWIPLFDGTNADSWRGFKQDALPAGWSVRDGNLITSGQGGDLGGDIISKKQFEDFRLYLEWNMSEGGNSGIFFNVIEGNNNAVYVSGPEYQLIDDLGFAYPLEEWQKSGANYAMHNADTSMKL